MPGQHDEFLAFAHELADLARRITLHYFRHPLGIKHKADNTPVTVADRTTEQLLRDKIDEHYPQHGIIGEEQGSKASQGAYEWIVDPIDGTKNFISGYPLYGTLICLLENGQPIVSLIDIPAQDERFFATVDMPTYYRKGKEERVVGTAQRYDLSEALLFSTDYTMFQAREHRQVKTLRESVGMVRYNGDCYLYAMLACGWIDLVLEADLKIYDFLPLMLIVTQAGGVISDWQGRPLTKQSSGQVLASANNTLHAAALAKIH